MFTKLGDFQLGNNFQRPIVSIAGTIAGASAIAGLCGLIFVSDNNQVNTYSSLTGELSSSRKIVSSIEETSGTTGHICRDYIVAGQSNAYSQITGNMAAYDFVQAVVNSTSAISGTLRADHALISSIEANSNVAWDGSQDRYNNGTIESVSSIAGQLKKYVRHNGSVPGTGGLDASLWVNHKEWLQSTLDVSSGLSGGLTVSKILETNPLVEAGLNGLLRTTKLIAGSLSASAGMVAKPTFYFITNVEITQTATVTGRLKCPKYIEAIGDANTSSQGDLTADFRSHNQKIEASSSLVADTTADKLLVSNINAYGVISDLLPAIKLIAGSIEVSSSLTLQNKAIKKLDAGSIESISELNSVPCKAIKEIAGTVELSTAIISNTSLIMQNMLRGSITAVAGFTGNIFILINQATDILVNASISGTLRADRRNESSITEISNLNADTISDKLLVSGIDAQASITNHLTVDKLNESSFNGVSDLHANNKPYLGLISNIGAVVGSIEFLKATKELVSFWNISTNINDVRTVADKFLAGEITNTSSFTGTIEAQKYLDGVILGASDIPAVKLTQSCKNSTFINTSSNISGVIIADKLLSGISEGSAVTSVAFKPLKYLRESHIIALSNIVSLPAKAIKKSADNINCSSGLSGAIEQERLISGSGQGQFAINGSLDSDRLISGEISSTAGSITFEKSTRKLNASADGTLTMSAVPKSTKKMVAVINVTITVVPTATADKILISSLAVISSLAGGVTCEKYMQGEIVINAGLIGTVRGIKELTDLVSISSNFTGVLRGIKRNLIIISATTTLGAIPTADKILIGNVPTVLLCFGGLTCEKYLQGDIISNSVIGGSMRGLKELTDLAPANTTIVGALRGLKKNISYIIGLSNSDSSLDAIKCLTGSGITQSVATGNLEKYCLLRGAISVVCGSDSLLSADKLINGSINAVANDNSSLSIAIYIKSVSAGISYSQGILKADKKQFGMAYGLTLSLGAVHNDRKLAGVLNGETGTNTSLKELSLNVGTAPIISNVNGYLQCQKWIAGAINGQSSEHTSLRKHKYFDSLMIRFIEYS